MNQSGTSVTNMWNTVAVLGQTQPEAGAAPAPSTPTPAVNPVGVPGAAPTTASPTVPGSSQPLGTSAPGTQAGGMGPMIWILPLMLIMMVGMSILTGRKDKKKRADLMSGVKKYDKVQMIGGIIGTVTEIGDDDVVLRVEEGKIRFSKTAVQAILDSSRSKGSGATIAELKSESKSVTV